MLKVFVLCVLAACVLAVDIPANMCSVKASGSTTLAGNTLSVEMLRVGDTAKYVISSPVGTVAYIFLRPDIDNGQTYFYSSLPVFGTGCVSRAPLLIRNYAYDDAEGVFKCTASDHLSATMAFDKQGVLASESFTLDILDPDSGEVTQTVSFVITYDSTTVDYDYVHETQDDTFSASGAVCSDFPSSQTPATQAITSYFCVAPVPTIPENMCSVKATGTATMSGTPVTLSVTMTRVRDTAKYVFTAMGTTAAQVFVRPDAGDYGATYIYSSQIGCIERSLLSIEGYSYDDSDGLFKFNSDGLDTTMTFENDVLKSEFFKIAIINPTSGAVSGYYEITINYNNVDYEYVHETQDNYFSAEGEICKDTPAQTVATEAITSDCPGHEIPIPESLCSVHGSGTATMSGVPPAYPVTFDMVRVKDTAKYTISVSDVKMASLYVRPDIQQGVAYLNRDGDGCVDREAPLLSSYHYDKSDGVYKFASDGLSATMKFDENGVLSAESILLNIFDPTSGEITETVEVSFAYTSVDYSYVHNTVDNTFSTDTEECTNFPDSKTQASQAITSDFCPTASGSSSSSEPAPPAGSSSVAPATTIPESMCSIKASGTANIMTYDYGVEMIRVKDTVKYTFTTGGVEVAAIYMRPDVEGPQGAKGRTYVKAPLVLQSLGGCVDVDFIALSAYEYDPEQGMFVITAGAVTGKIAFAGDKPVKEIIQAVITDPTSGAQMPVLATITYNSWDLSFRHDTKDGAFSVPDALCGEAAKTEAADAVTTEQCHTTASSVKPPTVPSSSSAYIAVPSALLLLVAAFLALF